MRPSCVPITKLNVHEHYETPTNNLQVITFLFMDKKVTKKTPELSKLILDCIWPQFRITAFTRSDEGIEGAEGLGLLLRKFSQVASPLISFLIGS